MTLPMALLQASASVTSQRKPMMPFAQRRRGVMCSIQVEVENRNPRALSGE